VLDLRSLRTGRRDKTAGDVPGRFGEARRLRRQRLIGDAGGCGLMPPSWHRLRRLAGRSGAAKVAVGKVTLPEEAAKSGLVARWCQQRGRRPPGTTAGRTLPHRSGGEERRSKRRSDADRAGTCSHRRPRDQAASSPPTKPLRTAGPDARHMREQPRQPHARAVEHASSKKRTKASSKT
jgi:hypothetical protein